MVEKGKDSLYILRGVLKHLYKSIMNFRLDLNITLLQGAEVPFFIWYDDYPEHASADFKGRVSKVQVGSQYGLASLILNDVKDTDRGWYNCKVLFLNREPNNAVVSHKLS